jgi:hypothetical protein
MSDYAALRELYYEALQLIPPEGGGARSAAEGGAQRGERRGEMSEGLRRDIEMYGNRNPDPKAEPALMQARTQAEWHKAQQNLVLSETPPENLAQALAVSGSATPTKEDMQKPAQDQIATAKRELEEMRQGQFKSGSIGRSAPQPASTPGYVPAPVQGQTPPVPGRPMSEVPTHRESHEQIAEANRQAAQIHGQAAQNPANQAQHAQAQHAHEEQAALHEMEAQGQPGAPEATLTEEQRQKQEEERRKAQEAQQRQQAPPQQQPPRNGDRRGK